MAEANEIVLEDDELIAGIKAAGLFFGDDLTKLEIPDEVLNKVPKDLATQYHLLPIRIDVDLDQLILVSDSAASSFMMSSFVFAFLSVLIGRT